MSRDQSDSKSALDTFALLPVLDWQEWDEAVRESEQSCIFLKASYLEASGLAKVARYITEDGKILGGILIPELFPELCTTSIRDYATYQSIWLKEKKQNNFRKFQNRVNILSKLATLLINCKGEVSLSLHWSIQDIRGLDWTFFKLPEKRIEFIPRYTGILQLKDFSNFEQYIASIASGRKYDFKLRKELSVTEHVDAVSVDTFLEMYSETVPFLTYDSRIYALEQVRKIIVDSIAAATGSLWLGQDETGKTVAGVFVQEFQGTLYYQFGASIENGLKYSPNAVILLKIIEKAFSDGAQIFDFVGINSPARGGFKSSLNATPQLYFQVHIK